MFCTSCGAKVEGADVFCRACGGRLLASQDRGSVQESRPNTFSLTVSIERQSAVLGFKSYSLLLNGIELFDDLQMGEIRKIELPIGKNSVQAKLNCTALITLSQSSNIIGFTAEPNLSYFLAVRFERSSGAPKIAFTAPDGTLLVDPKNSSNKTIAYSLVALAFILLLWAVGSSRNALPPLPVKPVHEGNEPASLAITTRVENTQGLCALASALSVGFAEMVGQRMRVPVSSVYLLRASDGLILPNHGCRVTVDTAKGPQTCDAADLYTDGQGSYWIGGSCI